jgi:hypothetical protein
MKTLISTLAVALALAFTGPAFAGDVTKATDKASCDKWLAACGTTRPRSALRRRCRGFLTALTASGLTSLGPVLFDGQQS